jgi:hypothetical protein
MRQPERQSKIWTSREGPRRDVREPNLRPRRFIREMRGSISAVAVLLLVAGLCGPCFGQVTTGPAHVQRGIVTTIDSVTMNFVCRGETGDRFYWVSRSTRFRAGRSNASFFDLRTGQPVEVISHDSGGLEVVDLVVL